MRIECMCEILRRASRKIANFCDDEELADEVDTVIAVLYSRAITALETPRISVVHMDGED